MSNNQRLKQLSNLIKTNKSVSVKELTDYFGVSDMTIRRDLNKLEGNGIFSRFHGGVKYVGEDPLEDRESYKIDEKKKLAKYCVSTIEPNDTIILDAGSTTHQIALSIVGSSLSNITVITNSLKIASTLQKKSGVSLILCGGELRTESGALIGGVARRFFKQIFTNKAFVSAGGITEAGFSTLSFSEGDIKRTIIQGSESSYIVADSSKLGHQSLNTFASINAVTGIITSEDMSSELKNFFKGENVDLKIVDN